MRFGLSEEQRLLQSTLTRLLEEHAPLDAVRNAAKLSSTELIEEVTRLEQGLKLVCGEIEFFKKEKDKKKPTKPKEGEDGAAEDVDGGADAACERFLLVMGPFHDGASPQVSELQRASSAMGEAGGNLKSFYSEEAKAIRDRCFTRLTPGQLLDTTMDTVADSVALDTTGDGKVDKVVPLAEYEATKKSDE